MSDDFPTYSEVGEQNVLEYQRRTMPEVCRVCGARCTLLERRICLEEME